MTDHAEKVGIYLSWVPPDHAKEARAALAALVDEREADNDRIHLLAQQREDACDRAEAAETENARIVRWFMEKPWSQPLDARDFGGHPYSDDERAIGYGTYRDPRFLPPSLARAAIAAVRAARA